MATWQAKKINGRSTFVWPTKKKNNTGNNKKGYIYIYIHIFCFEPWPYMSELWSDQNVNYCTISKPYWYTPCSFFWARKSVENILIGGGTGGSKPPASCTQPAFLPPVPFSLAWPPFVMPFLNGLLFFIIFFTYFRGATFPSMLKTPSVTINFRRAPSASLSFSSRSNEGYNEYNTLVNPVTQTWSGDIKTDIN